MSATTSIEWTDRTWNPVVGCDRISPGCAHCYAKTLHDNRHKAYLTGKPMAAQYAHPFETVQLKPERLLDPLSWRKPAKVFVNSVSDLFHEDVPWSYIERVFDVMQESERHTFQILTKRAENMRLFAENWALHHNGPLSNVWLGVSVENQHFADERIPFLLQTPAAVRFLSVEPMLGPIDLRLCDEFPSADGGCYEDARHGLHWVIVGGESGSGARRCGAQWVRSIVRQCQECDVPVFVKQLGSVVIDRNDAGFRGDEPHHWPEIHSAEDRIEHDLDGTRDGYQGAPVRIHLQDRKGGDRSEWPEDLRVREWPLTEAR
jgi:protein gp37